MSNRRAIWVFWLLCVTVTAASLDRVPDPPAIKQRIGQSQSVDFAEQIQHAVNDTRQGPCDRPDSNAPVLWPAFKGALEPPCTPGDSPLMRQAADPSPPTPAQ